MRLRSMTALGIAAACVVVVLAALREPARPGDTSRPSSRSGAPARAAAGFDARGALDALRPGVVAAAPGDALNAPDALPITGVTFLVNTTDDADDMTCDAVHCSLREALNAANATPATRDHVTFDITASLTVPYGGATPRHIITPTSALPLITGPVFIDGFTEPDYAGAAVIALNGDGLAADGLHFSAPEGSVVQGLMVYGFDGDGLVFDTGGGSFVLQNTIGTDVDGAGSLANTGDGIRILGVMSNTLGGNTLAGNLGAGVLISGTGASGNLLQSNFVGAAYANGARPGNGGDGVMLVDAPGNTLEANFIGGNGGSGVAISGTLAVSNVVRSNIVGSTVPVGLDGSFGADLPNGADGLRLTNAGANRILGNTIARSGGHGIVITGALAVGNAVYGNRIGADDTTWPGGDLGNGGDGVRIEGGASETCVGGRAGYARCPGDPSLPTSGNTIAFNGGDGVAVAAGTGNTVRFNAIYTNAGQAIDLDADGPTANDAGDPDAGANNLQNFPEITRLSVNCTLTGTTELVIELDAPAGLYDVDIFVNAIGTFAYADGPEAQKRIQSATVPPGPSTIPLPPADTNNLSITATDAAGNTSEVGFRLGALLEVNADTDPLLDSYEFKDSNDLGGPTFAFVDISGTGTDVDAGDETVTGTLPITFTFEHFAVPYTDVWLSSNGWLSFTDPTGDPDPTNDCPLPSAAGVDGLIAAVWDDLDASVAGAAVFYQSFAAGTCPYGTYPGACFIAQWNDVVHKGTSDDLTFEIILFDDHTFLIQILDAGDEAGSGSTTGTENATAMVAVNYGCDRAAAIADNLAIRFTPALLGDAATGDGLCEIMVGGGVCTLRAAIDESNALPGFDNVTFDIFPPGKHTIAPTSTLTIVDPLSIDGDTQPPPNGSPIHAEPQIYLDGGGGVGDALRVESGSSTIRELGIVSYSGHGIRVVERGCNTLADNVIGAMLPAMGGMGLGGDGIHIQGVISNTLVGNVIVDNAGNGVAIRGAAAMFNVLRDNLIGIVGDYTTPPPDALPPSPPVPLSFVALGNAGHGVVIENGSRNSVGTVVTATTGSNVIAASGGHGVLITGTLATGNRVVDNRIGVDYDGDDPVGNALDGVRIEAVDGATGDPAVTGTLVEGNTVGDNGGYGVAVVGATARGHVISGNTIGTDEAGTVGITNTLSGVLIDAGSLNEVTGNLISSNGLPPSVGHGIEVRGTAAMSNTLAGNTIGTNRAGTAALPNVGNGIDIAGASKTAIDGNHVAGNGDPVSGVGGYGVRIAGATATGNTLRGNFIGVDVGASAAISNTRSGVLIDGAPGNTIGVASGSVTDVNVISGNGVPALPGDGHGVVIRGAAATGNVVQGNVIGLNYEGFGSVIDTPIPNQRSGVFVDGAPGNTIGGVGSFTDNTIGGNGEHGIHIAGAGATGNAIQGNTIGSDPSGTATGLGNTGSGILIDGGASGTCVGAEPGFTPCPAPPGESGFNRIVLNGAAGITVTTGTGNAMIGNEIADNAALGIDLGGDGVTANDGAGDGDGGANNLQNFPVLTSAQSLGAPFDPQTMIAGTLPSSGGPFRLDFYRNTACDPSNFGEGAVFIGAESGVAPGAFMVTLNLQVPVGEFITVTATDPGGNTSELSACVEVEEKPTPTPTQTPTETPTPTATNTHTPQPTLTPSNTPTPYPPDPTVILAPVADARVQNSNPTSNYGTSTQLRVRGGTTTYNTYLRFEVVDVLGPIYRARLRVFAYDGSNLGGAVYTTATDWGETTITWNNAPVISGSPLDTRGAVADNTWVEYDVTEAITGNGPIGFGIKTTSTNSLYFNAREASSNRPELVIDYLGPSATPSATGTGPTATGQPTAGASATATRTPTAAATATPGATPTRTATAAPTTAATATRTATPISTTAASPTATRTPTAGATATPASVIVLTPAHDARVKSDSPNANYGGDTVLRLRAGTPAYTTYLKFTVAGVQGTVQRATLRLYATDGGDDGGSAFVVSNAYAGTSNPWLESGLTWNNAPAIGGSPLATVGTIGNNQWAAWDVTAAVTGDGTFSFGLNTGSTNSVYFNSKEASANRPELVIELASGTADATATTAASATAVPTQTAVATATRTPTGAPTTAPTATRTATPPATQAATATAGATQPATATATRTPTAGATPTAAPIVLAPVHDGRVKSDSPTTSYGTSDYLRLRSTGPTYDSYLKFDVTGVAGQVQQATLRLWAYDGADAGGAAYAVSNNYRSTSTPWVETGLTWDNAPAISGSPLDTVGAVANNAWAEYDVTAAVAGNGTVSFGLRTTSTNSLYFNAREAATNRPQLVILVGGGAPPDRERAGDWRSGAWPGRVPGRPRVPGRSE